MSWTNAQKKYAKSSKGLAARRKYQLLAKGKTAEVKIAPMEIKEKEVKMEKEAAKK